MIGGEASYELWLFRKYIGYSVCSGPDGTVSLMTEEEELVMKIMRENGNSVNYTA